MPAPATPVRVEPDWDFQIRAPARRNQKLREALANVNRDYELKALWYCANKNAVDRLGMSDHGPVHVQIVANIALRLLRMLLTAGVQASCVADYELTNHDAEVIVVLASLLHDIGLSIHRPDHEHYSLFLASPKLREVLSNVYAEPATRTIVISEILHAIISHRSDGRPLTIEAGVVRVADALDMAKGRSRIPFEQGKVNIHSLSASAIEKVHIMTGQNKPISIEVLMNNSAGIFQLDELLKEKLRHSGLEPYVEVIARIETESEKRLVQTFKL